MEHIAQNWRLNDVRYNLKAKAEISPSELQLLLDNGATLSQILTLKREDLEKLFPDLTQELAVFAFPRLSVLQAAK